MKDAGGKVVYVGKAKNLRVRVRQYFRPGDDQRFFRRRRTPFAGSLRDRHGRRRQRKGGAPPRESPHQGAPASLQHQAPGRQAVPGSPHRSSRVVPARRSRPPHRCRRCPLLWPLPLGNLVSRDPPHHQSLLQAPDLQRPRPRQSQPPLPAVPDPPLSGAMRVSGRLCRLPRGGGGRDALSRWEGRRALAATSSANAR